jgi:hypothetical protein
MLCAFSHASPLLLFDLMIDELFTFKWLVTVGFLSDMVDTFFSSLNYSKLETIFNPDYILDFASILNSRLTIFLSLLALQFHTSLVIFFGLIIIFKIQLFRHITLTTQFCILKTLHSNFLKEAMKTNLAIILHYINHIVLSPYAL